MDVKRVKEGCCAYLGRSSQRRIVLQSTSLAAVTMLVAYAYGALNFVPEGLDCPTLQPSLRMNFDPSRCLKVPEVIVFPQPWLAMLVSGVVGTVVLGILSATLYRSIFARYVLGGWLGFCTVVALAALLSYSNAGRFPGAYFVVYPATTVVAFVVAAACIAAIANIVLRTRGGPEASRS